jgi:hypothetical protein
LRAGRSGAMRFIGGPGSVLLQCGAFRRERDAGQPPGKRARL